MSEEKDFEFKITMRRLESLLRQQKEIVIDRLAANSGSYNTESDGGNYRTLPIDKDKFKQTGMKAEYPDDFKVLQKYIPN